MRPLTNHEKRTIRLAAIGIAIYLALFYGARGWQWLERQRTQYQQWVLSAESIKRQLQPYENRVLLLEKLKKNFQFDPARLSRTTLVAQASAAIQRAAQSGNVQLGPMRESSARPAAKELASMQLEGTGQVPAILNFLQRLETLGYPLVIDSVQINGEPTRPDMVKLTLTIVILDFEQFKTEPAPRRVSARGPRPTFGNSDTFARVTLGGASARRSVSRLAIQCTGFVERPVAGPNSFFS